jgi:hypothetical protein
VTLPKGRIAGIGVVVRQELLQLNKSGVDLLAPLIQFIRLVPELFVLIDQSRIVWIRHRKPAQ